MKRHAAILAALALLTLTAPPAGAQPNIYHTIYSSHGSANVDRTDGCERVEIFLSSSVAAFASQPGPVNKQGLTGVFLRISDVCAGLAAAAAPGGSVLFQADGQSLAPLTIDPRLETASIDAELPGTDGDGNPVTIRVSASWTGVGPLEHSTVNSHELFPGVGNVSATDNNLRRAAVATVSVAAGPYSVSGTDPNAVLERVKSRCVEVARPGVEEFFPCFGFPG
ncbi:hypothetical protein [Arthrobacter cupressi]|uniref:Uncharacterized protein n=1 Tax=Arthrobacter cupressi TaxID=1045773 RepID=A0A1G8WDC9_9MICC|nr:hypothetical protein [Arthrobacter cupressi]NYD76314.1 hypothetical protein [Arthrobacter cupressi]SDJ76329.1 hypothetical protein SAMN05216555_11649 [Arthrobacter cupressi]